MNESARDKAIVLFDGFCNFCSGSVRFIIRRDPGSIFMFAASQSPAGEKIIDEYGIGKLARHSIVLIKDRKIYQKSDAALRIAAKLRGLWPLLSGFFVFPRAFRDMIYDMIARNRYRFYGTRDQCFVPDAGIHNRFL
ncbi:thiol-disulfide oxidoreductase DCC family protein [Bacteroidota bacterium]